MENWLLTGSALCLRHCFPSKKAPGESATSFLGGPMSGVQSKHCRVPKSIGRSLASQIPIPSGMLVLGIDILGKLVLFYPCQIVELKIFSDLSA
jgi:hypothetical protein